MGVAGNGPTQKAVFHFKAPTFISALIAEIDSKLQELASRNGKVAELERMLLELKEHEQRNTALIDTLMDHLHQTGLVCSNDQGLRLILTSNKKVRGRLTHPGVFCNKYCSIWCFFNAISIPKRIRKQIQHHPRPQTLSYN